MHAPKYTATCNKEVLYAVHSPFDCRVQELKQEPVLHRVYRLKRGTASMTTCRDVCTWVQCHQMSGLRCDVSEVCGKLCNVRAELDTVQAAERPTLQHVRRVMWHTRQGHVLQERQECPGYILCALQGRRLQCGMAAQVSKLSALPFREHARMRVVIECSTAPTTGCRQAGTD
jgi:hypothetical protein